MMNSLNLVMLASSVVGTTVMLAVLEVLTLTHAVDGQLPQALGSELLKREKGSLQVGIVAHYIFGISFGFLYTNLVVLAEPESKLMIVLWCLGYGVLHGFLMTIVMLGLARRHPSPRFRDRPLPCAAAHGVAVVAYALSLGITFALLAPFAEFE